jgi:hypothetical protein
VARIYDLVMTHGLDADDFFIHRVQEHCARAGLNFFLIEPVWIEAFLERFARGDVWARVLFNMHSEHHLPDDVYHRLVRLASQRNTQVIDPLEVAIPAFDKARVHTRLEAAGIPVPPTLIVPRDRMADFRLTDADRARLGTPFIIKPAMGYGRRGVILDATGENDLARSVAVWPDTHYLLQQRIVPAQSNGDPAYFRVYHLFGTVWVCWWNCFTDRYRLISEAERATLPTGRLEALSRQLAELTGMRFFSSEIALDHEGQPVVIDYVNDQCHLLSQSASPAMGVPDALVAAIARRVVEGVQELVRR